MVRGLVPLLAIYYAYALYPYEFRRAPPPNAAERMADGTLSFAAPGIAVLEDATGVRAGERLGIAFDATPALAAADGERRTLVRVSGVPGRPQIALEQHGVDLCVRLGTQQFPWQRDCVTARGVFAGSAPVAIAAALSADALEIAIDGRIAVSRALDADERAPAPPGLQVLVGNIENSAQPWFGRLANLQVTIDDADLHVPRRAVVPTHVPTVEHAPRLVPLRGLRAFDAFQNFAGFLPLGAWLALLAGPGAERRRTLLRALGVGAAVGLSIEIVQWWLPARFVSIDDLWLNATGCAAGAWLGGLWLAARTRRRSMRT